MNETPDKEEVWIKYTALITRLVRILMVSALVIQVYTTHDPEYLAAVGAFAGFYAALMAGEIFILSRPRKKKRRSDLVQEERRVERLSLEELSQETLEHEYVRRRKWAGQRYEDEIADIERDYQRALVRQTKDAQEMNRESQS